MAQLDQSDPVVIADTGPLLRLAAAELLDAMRLTNRQIIIVDMVEIEACHRDSTKPYAKEILDWIERSGTAIKRVETDIGLAYKARLEKNATPENIKRLTKLNRDGGERAVRDYIEYLEPQDIHSVLVLHEDQKVPELMRAARVPVHLMTTRLFIQTLAQQGMNIDVETAIEKIRNSPVSNLAVAEEHFLRPYDVTN